MDAKSKIRRVKVMIDLEYSACRDILTGISNYIRHHHCLWQIQLNTHPKEATPDDLDGQVDGFIVDDAVATNCRDALRAKNVPTVVTGSPADFPSGIHQRVAFIHNDNYALGELGAKHLLSLGPFRSFAFVTEPEDPLWCRQRREGFRRALETRGLKLYVPGSQTLAEFLPLLPAPAAILCANDKVGAEVVATCGTLKIRIPKNAVVLGIDNDHVLCEIANPRLSSIQVDHVWYGMMAAEALNRLLTRHAPGVAREVLNTRFKIVQRKSTTPVATSVNLAEKAIRYVRANVMNNPSVDSVIEHLGVSRQLAYLRFRETSAKTLAKFILDARLNEVARRLQRTHRSIAEIAKTCSFDNLQHLSNAFKRRYGVTMSEYRAARQAKITPA